VPSEGKRTWRGIALVVRVRLRTDCGHAGIEALERGLKVVPISRKRYQYRDLIAHGREIIGVVVRHLGLELSAVHPDLVADRFALDEFEGGGASRRHAFGIHQGSRRREMIFV
jgi:hypothetical protein